MNEHLAQLLTNLLSSTHTPVRIFGDLDVTYLDRALLDEQGRVRVLPAKDLLKIPEDHFRFWCHKQAIYTYPTTELIEWLQEQIGKRSAIEIGAGNGAIGRALGIPITDSRMQEWPDVKAQYAISRQPTVNYGSDIQEFDAPSAVEHFKPDVVIGSWITHLYHPNEHHLGGNMYGVDEVALLGRVKKYVHIGATSSHSKKRILKKPHQIYQFDWLLGRGTQDTRCIWVWTFRVTTQ